jgi:hypothetical protein
MIEQRFLTVAEELCRRTGRRPREAFMRRAASTAYYAVFHALCRLCADELIGGSRAKTVAWGRVYRAVEHQGAKKTFLSNEATAIGPAVASFGRAFASLQEARHDADYNPVFFRYFFDETQALVERARQAIQDLYGMSSDNRQALATLVLFKARGSGAKP